MQWPKDILDLFDKALTIVPAPGLDKATVLRALLDETARRATWRAGGHPGNARVALRTPYTPMGSVIGESINGMAHSLGLGGERWSQAVNAFHNYVEHNAEEVFAAFRGVGEPYPHDLGFGAIALPTAAEPTAEE